MLVEEGTGPGVIVHGPGNVAHLIVKVADGPVQGRPGVVYVHLGISVGARGRNGPLLHLSHALQGFPKVDKCAVVLLPGPEILANVPVCVIVGQAPALPEADGQGLAGVENTFFRVHLLVAQHQLPIGIVEVYQFLGSGLVDGIRRPGGDGPFQGIEVVAAVIVIGKRRQGDKNGQKKEQELFHRHEDKKKALNSAEGCRSPSHFHPLGWCFSLVE